MNDILENVFNQTMRREQHEISTYTTGEHFKCFFRKSNDTISRRDTMTLYYRVDAPVKIGTLLCFGGNIYLTLNKETIENDVYYKSAVIKANGAITTHSLSVVDLPIYSNRMNDSVSDGDANISILSGNSEFLTEDGDISRKLKINETFNVFGRTWKITNMFFVDGLCHIISEVYSDIEISRKFEIHLSTLSCYNCLPGDTDKLTATAYCNDNRTPDANIVFASSNEGVASIDQNGNIEYLADGEVYFTAKWPEYNVSQSTKNVLVASTPIDDTVSIYVDELDVICYDFSETLKYYAVRGGVRDDTIPVKFKIENLKVPNRPEVYMKKITITDNGNGTIELLVSDQVMRGKSFDLVAYNDEFGVENRQTINVISLF